MDKIDTMLDALGIPKKLPKGSFYDVTSDEDKEESTSNNAQGQKRNPAGQLGNQNARRHGLYSKLIPANDPHKFHHVVQTDDLSNEIAFLRLKLDSLINDPDAGLDQTLKLITLLGRLVNIQRRYT